MEQYAGIDVSLESSSVCVVDGTGHVIREAKIASESETLVAWFGGLDLPLTRTRLQVRVNLPSHSLRHGSLRLSTERPLSNLQPGLKCQAHFTFRLGQIFTASVSSQPGITPLHQCLFGMLKLLRILDNLTIIFSLENIIKHRIPTQALSTVTCKWTKIQ